MPMSEVFSPCRWCSQKRDYIYFFFFFFVDQTRTRQPHCGWLSTDGSTVRFVCCGQGALSSALKAHTVCRLVRATATYKRERAGLLPKPPRTADEQPGPRKMLRPGPHPKFSPLLKRHSLHAASLYPHLTFLSVPQTPPFGSCSPELSCLYIYIYYCEKKKKPLEKFFFIFFLFSFVFGLRTGGRGR